MLPDDCLVFSFTMFLVQILPDPVYEHPTLDSSNAETKLPWILELRGKTGKVYSQTCDSQIFLGGQSSLTLRSLGNQNGQLFFCPTQK